jgi:hypothetical protein
VVIARAAASGAEPHNLNHGTTQDMNSFRQRIGVIHIATGQYRTFSERFISSAIYGLEPHCDKIFYVFSDNIPYSSRLIEYYGCKAHCIKITHAVWPTITLYRYHYMYEIYDLLLADRLDYVFFANANAVFVSATPIQELESSNKDICFVAHPAYYNKMAAGTFERNPGSSAGMPEITPSEHIYVQGFFFGGRRSPFLKMVSALKDSVQRDLDNGVRAIWYDESHLNMIRIKQWIDRSVTLNPGYAFPEGWTLPFRCHILALDKSKEFDVLSFKHGKNA